MRSVALSVCTLILAACGGAGSADEVRVELPLNSPEGAHRLVADFIDVCSLSLINPKESRELAQSRGWSDEGSGGSDIAMLVAGVATLSDDSSGALLQLIPAVYPHLDTKMCMLILQQPEDSGEDLNPEIIHQTAGLQGGFMPMPGGSGNGIGRWSFIASNGQTVLVNATMPTERFMQMNMSTHKHLNPK